MKVVDRDEADVTQVIESFLTALDGPDWSALPAGVDKGTTVFLGPRDRAGQAPTWPTVYRRLKKVLVGARKGPPRPRLKIEWPRFNIEVRGAIATVTWRTYRDARHAYAPRITRTMVLLKDGNAWRIRHVQLWCLPILMQVRERGVLKWVDVRPWLRHERLAEQLADAEDAEEVLSF
jgi:hypothetical protein